MVEATFVQRSACLTQENMGAFQIDIQLEFFSTFFLLIATGKPCSSFVTFSASLVCVCVCVYTMKWFMCGSRNFKRHEIRYNVGSRVRSHTIPEISCFSISFCDVGLWVVCRSTDTEPDFFSITSMWTCKVGCSSHLFFCIFHVANMRIP